MLLLQWLFVGVLPVFAAPASPKCDFDVSVMAKNVLLGYSNQPASTNPAPLPAPNPFRLHGPNEASSGDYLSMSPILIKAVQIQSVNIITPSGQDCSLQQDQQDALFPMRCWMKGANSKKWFDYVQSDYDSTPDRTWVTPGTGGNGLEGDSTFDHVVCQMKGSNGGTDFDAMIAPCWYLDNC